MGAARKYLSGSHAKGLMLAVSGILVLSPDSLLVRLIAADQWSLLFWRGLLTFVTLAAYLLFTDGRTALTRLAGTGCLGFTVALLFALNTSLFVISIRHTSVANTLVLLSVAPLFAALFSSMFLGEHAPPRTWVAMLIGVASITMILSQSLGAANLLGDGAAIALAVTMAAILTIMRQQRSNNAIPIVALSGLLLAIAVFPFAQPLSLAGDDWLFMGLLGLLVIPLSFALTLSAPRYLPAPEVGLIFLLETVLGPFLVWLFIGEEPPSATLIGGGLLILTLIVHGLLGMRSDLAKQGRK